MSPISFAKNNFWDGTVNIERIRIRTYPTDPGPEKMYLRIYNITKNQILGSNFFSTKNLLWVKNKTKYGFPFIFIWGRWGHGSRPDLPESTVEIPIRSGYRYLAAARKSFFWMRGNDPSSFIPILLANCGRWPSALQGASKSTRSKEAAGKGGLPPQLESLSSAQIPHTLPAFASSPSCLTLWIMWNEIR